MLQRSIHHNVDILLLEINLILLAQKEKINKYTDKREILLEAENNVGINFEENENKKILFIISGRGELNCCNKFF